MRSREKRELEEKFTKWWKLGETMGFVWNIVQHSFTKGQ